MWGRRASTLTLRVPAAGGFMRNRTEEAVLVNWWEEAEARARRTQCAANLAQVLWQRFQAAGMDPDLSFVPAYDLAALQLLCADLVRLVEALLIVVDGDAPSLRRQAMALCRWAETAHHWTVISAPAFNQLLDSLDLEADALALREAVEPDGPELPPEEQPKLEGRYQYWHLLYERLDLKFASVGMEEAVHRGLAHSMARIYEQALVTVRMVGGLEKETSPRFRGIARLLLEVNTTWHFDLGPYHLGHGQVRARGGASVGLQAWLLRALAR